jgi:hypothetical protein
VSRRAAPTLGRAEEKLTGIINACVHSPPDSSRRRPLEVSHIVQLNANVAQTGAPTIDRSLNQPALTFTLAAAQMIASLPPKAGVSPITSRSTNWRRRLAGGQVGVLTTPVHFFFSMSDPLLWMSALVLRANRFDAHEILTNFKNGPYALLEDRDSQREAIAVPDFLSDGDILSIFGAHPTQARFKTEKRLGFAEQMRQRNSEWLSRWRDPGAMHPCAQASSRSRCRRPPIRKRSYGPPWCSGSYSQIQIPPQ